MRKFFSIIRVKDEQEHGISFEITNEYKFFHFVNDKKSLKK